ncbi:hypothetical protein SAMN02745975_01555 [Geosporobacter subterraneus DSM 17957]|uniref:Uncharacterized protein n=1 Tax=Geosporobacter subterraneus DSM 17957 TaxID=1121919 RepID=A0A1M6HHP4_9FIRM|nr:hypothetical protein [Geosporobacter subterraneus]SHJ21711.1 hypothetical protein SAMN02745975_01555 [Geosporobacter subterraneus DSM 17957]
MTERQDRINEEIEDLKNIYQQLDEVNQKRLEEAIILLKTKFSERLRI